MASLNKLRLDFSGNPSLQDWVTSKRIGDQCTFEVTASVDQIGDEEAVMTIHSIAIEEDEGRENIEPNGEEPVMMVIMKRSGEPA
jgi:hypothetical protein